MNQKNKRRDPGHQQTTLTVRSLKDTMWFSAMILLVGCEFHNFVILVGVGFGENHRLCDEYTAFHHLQMFRVIIVKSGM
jgi:hypothetical protein